MTTQPRTTEQAPDSPPGAEPTAAVLRKHASLAEALLAAQMDIVSVVKDAQHGKANSDWGYKYTSADEMVDACRKVLHANGLLARRKSWTHTALERTIDVEYFDNAGKKLSEVEHIPIFEVKSTLILTLAHKGESEEIELPWVAIPGKGRPADKAIAGALTTCNSYWLLGLLQVPRVDENEMNKRDDGPQRGQDDRRAEARRQSEQQHGPAQSPTKDGQAAASSRQVAQKPPERTGGGKTLAQAKKELVDKCREWMMQAGGERPADRKVFELCKKVLLGLKCITESNPTTQDMTAFNHSCTWVQARIDAKDPMSVLDGDRRKVESAEPSP